MANQLGGSPWVIDTPSAVAIHTSRLKLVRLMYAGFGAQTDFVEVQDQDGKVRAFLQGNTTQTPVQLDLPLDMNGLLVPVTSTVNGGANLPSGRLFVYYG